jgi:hypothetical protein
MSFDIISFVVGAVLGGGGTFLVMRKGSTIAATVEADIAKLKADVAALKAKV